MLEMRLSFRLILYWNRLGATLILLLMYPDFSRICHMTDHQQGQSLGSMINEIAQMTTNIADSIHCPVGLEVAGEGVPANLSGND